ncbi:MAG: dethiobiotin synthase [Rhodospirillaceae bacterium]|nr:dethiobiotin synthase [Rhodospirillaceae bacterium]
MLTGFVVTGTDTDVGKTMTTAALSLWVQSQGLDIAPMKPTQTGATFRDGIWNAPDLDFTLDMLGRTPQPDERHLMQPFCFEPACSPHLAVKAGDTPPTVAAIVAAATALAARHNAIVVEGAGGLMVPLNADEMMIDLFAALALPVVLVGRVGLGSINHVLLSLEALKSRNIPILGVVLNETQPQNNADAFIRADNPRSIEHFGGVRCLGTLPFTPEPTPARLLAAASALPGLPSAFASLLGD